MNFECFGAITFHFLNQIIMKTRSGISSVVVVIILLLLAVAGGGGVLAYKYTTDPDFDFYGLPVYDYAPFLRRAPDFVPQALVEFVPGANAEGVFVYKRTEDISPWLNIMDDLIHELAPNTVSDEKPQSSLNDVVAVLAAYKSSPGTGDYPNGSVVAALQFNSAEKAVALNEYISQFILLLPIRTALSGDVLTFEMDSEGLSGNVLDCPLWKRADVARTRNNVVFLANVRDSEEMALFTDMMINMMPAGEGFGLEENRAGADDFGGILSLAVSASDSPLSLFRQNLGVMMMFAEFNQIYMKVKVGTGELVMITDFVDEQDIPILAEERAGAGNIVSADELVLMYNEGITELNKAIPGVLAQIRELDFDGTVDINMESNRLAVIIKTLVPKEIISSAGDIRDNQRKIDLKAIIAALESYKLDSGEYPGESSCVDMISGLEKYFVTAGLPKDPQGLREFGIEGPCTSGYFYQYFGGDNYGVWAKVENEDNGNTAWPLIGEENMVDVMSTGAGPYFFVYRGEVNVPADEVKVSNEVGAGGDSTISVEIKDETTNKVPRAEGS